MDADEAVVDAHLELRGRLERRALVVVELLELLKSQRVRRETDAKGATHCS